MSDKICTKNKPFWSSSYACKLLFLTLINFCIKGNHIYLKTANIVVFFQCKNHASHYSWKVWKNNVYCDPLRPVWPHLDRRTIAQCVQTHLCVSPYCMAKLMPIKDWMRHSFHQNFLTNSLVLSNPVLFASRNGNSTSCFP